MGIQPPPPPPIRGHPGFYSEISLDLAAKAIETVKNALPYIIAGPPLVHRGPRGDIGIDIPIMYHGFALDRIHIDPRTLSPSPKGRPARVFLGHVSEPNYARLRQVAEEVVKELRVVEAVEFREPEDAWVVPLAWKLYIVAHVKVSRDGTELIPDYPLTEEVRRYAI